MRNIKVSAVLLLFYRQICAYPQKMDVLRQFQNLSWCKPDWCFPSMSKETNELLKQCINLPKAEICDDVEEVIKKSKVFPISFPIDTMRLETLKLTRPIEKLHYNIVSTYPIIHERVLLLMTHFLIYKREFGTNVEKALYKDMTVPELIDRILKKRAISFMGPNDSYKLFTGEEDEENWETIGTVHQKPPLVLSKCLSYDELKLSAMVYVSGHTECINDGGRYNKGIPSDNAQPNAVIIGLIGPRFEKKFRMEYEDIIISDQQNCLENGYGEEVTPTTCLNVLKTTYVRNNVSARNMWRQMWSEFYQVHSYTYEELISYVNIQEKSEVQKYTDRYVPLYPDTEHVFDNEVYYKRLRILAECALLEADSRANDSNTTAYLNIVGCGLGVWKISAHQTDVYVLTFLERIRNLLKNNMLQHVSDVNFAYIKPSTSITALFTNLNETNNEQVVDEKRIFFECKRHPNGGISVTIQNREPSAKLAGEHAGKLLVITYPWDSNAHPGNEFWLGSLTGSGDPAAASSTQIAELHNAHINNAVTALNVKVAGSMGVKSLSEYCEKLV